MTDKSKSPAFDEAIAAMVEAETARARLAKRTYDATDPTELLSVERAAKGGGKLSRSETVTVRLDPKLRYLAELAGRLHRRTLSSYVEWSIKEALDSETLGYDEGVRCTIGTEAEYLWDVDESDRFAKLALRYPHLLSHEEQVRWKLIRENGFLWKGVYTGPQNEWTWKVTEDSFIYPRLREHWAAFCRVSDTGDGKDQLPTWVQTEPIRQVPPRVSSLRSPPPAHPAPRPPGKSGFDDMDDDIPF